MAGPVRMSAVGYPEHMWTPRMREFEDGLVRYCEVVRGQIAEFAEHFAKSTNDPYPQVYRHILMSYTGLDRLTVVRGGAPASVSRMVDKMIEGNHLVGPHATEWMSRMLQQKPGNPRIYFLRRMFKLDTSGASVLRKMVEHLYRN